MVFRHLRVRWGAGVQATVTLALVLGALLACKKSEENKDLPEVETPPAETTPEPAVTPPEPTATEAPAEPAATDSAQAEEEPADAGASTPSPQPRPVADAGTARPADAGTAAPRDAGTTAPRDAGGGTVDVRACARACQTELQRCLGRLADGGSNATCVQALSRCTAACRR